MNWENLCESSRDPTGWGFFRFAVRRHPVGRGKHIPKGTFPLAIAILHQLQAGNTNHQGHRTGIAEGRRGHGDPPGAKTLRPDGPEQLPGEPPLAVQLDDPPAPGIVDGRRTTSNRQPGLALPLSRSVTTVTMDASPTVPRCAACRSSSGSPGGHKRTGPVEARDHPPHVRSCGHPAGPEGHPVPPRPSSRKPVASCIDSTCSPLTRDGVAAATGSMILSSVTFQFPGKRPIRIPPARVPPGRRTDMPSGPWPARRSWMKRPARSRR